MIAIIDDSRSADRATRLDIGDYQAFVLMFASIVPAPIAALCGKANHFPGSFGREILGLLVLSYRGTGGR